MTRGELRYYVIIKPLFDYLDLIIVSLYHQKCLIDFHKATNKKKTRAIRYTRSAWPHETASHASYGISLCIRAALA